MKSKIILGVFALIILVVLMGIKHTENEDYTIYKFSISDDVKEEYISIVDSISEDKIQVNWREVLAVNAAFNNGKIGKYTKENIKNTSKMFIIKEKDTYKLSSIASVIEGLGGKNEEIVKAKKYLDVIDEKLEMEDGYKKDFINSIKEGVMKTGKESGMLPSVVVAQAALESNWGRSELSSKYNNLFGIKADTSWEGERINIATTENYDTRVKEDFRIYKSKSDSIVDFGRFMKENPRYKKAGVFDMRTYKSQIKAVENAGYSTVKDKDGNEIYAEYIIDIILDNELQILDWELRCEDRGEKL